MITKNKIIETLIASDEELVEATEMRGEDLTPEECGNILDICLDTDVLNNKKTPPINKFALLTRSAFLIGYYNGLNDFNESIKAAIEKEEN